MKRAWIAGVVIALTACSGGDQKSESPEEAVMEVAGQQLADFSDGNYADAWARLTADDQGAVPEDDYVAISEACGAQDLDYEVTSARISGDNAVVRYELDDAERSAQLRLEDGEWRWVLSDGTRGTYSLGMDEAISALVNANSC